MSGGARWRAGSLKARPHSGLLPQGETFAALLECRAAEMAGATVSSREWPRSIPAPWERARVREVVDPPIHLVIQPSIDATDEHLSSAFSEPLEKLVAVEER